MSPRLRRIGQVPQREILVEEQCGGRLIVFVDKVVIDDDLVALIEEVVGNDRADITGASEQNDGAVG